jgi:hypothetical protein
MICIRTKRYVADLLDYHRLSFVPTKSNMIEEFVHLNTVSQLALILRDGLRGIRLMVSTDKCCVLLTIVLCDPTPTVLAF